ncbi:LacI family DNA-binding transcriptional regulator [Burkholderia cenocepacia]|uniref:LacI family DNA-binding transcriptional regulator n=1 Tax=Burkholderia cenocepacia TaxID=95486 RepID=UPI001B9D5187|nr:LacI family DNA-binding transcriptional regulator [Burkholderia cenocepacia]MBR8168047.1 LacI family DNA-binding transcriptional regulator [Burkholderia cenocepacia]
MNDQYKEAVPPPSARGGASITLQDVARLAGVTSMTVSRVLNRPELVRSETRQRVLDAVAQTGYVPNLLAGALASNRSRLVALLLPTIATPIFTEPVQAIMDTLGASGYQTLLGLTNYSTQREEQLVETLLGRRPDGIILTGTDHTPLTLKRLKQANVPIVELWDLTDDPIDTVVGFSHEEVGAAVARHLIAKGYRRFGVVSLDDPRGLRRSRSAMRELQQHGMEMLPMLELPAPATLQTGRDALVRLLDGPLPDVLVCSTDTLALGILAEAANRGMKLPDDVAVMGFGDLSTAAYAHPALSTVRIDGAAIGQLAARALLARLDEEQAVSGPAPSRIDTGFTIVDRESA